MKKILISLLVITTTYSCKKSNVTLNSPLKLLPDSNILVSSPKNPAGIPLNNDKTYNLLGYGYDITGKFADSSAVRSKAVDVAAYDVNNPGRCVVDLSSEANSQIINAENAESYSQQLSSRLAESRGLNMFKGSLVTLFPGVNALSSKYVYGNYVVIIRQKGIKMQQNYGLLKNYLTTDFIHDSQTDNAADLVKKYGTHVLSDIVLGAKLTITYQAETTQTNRLASESAGFRYAMAKVFGLSTGELDPINTNDLSAISSPKLVYEAVGADQSKLKLNTASIIPTVNITDWHLSSTPQSSVLINISENGLIPLYELIADPAKQIEVKTYIANYLNNQRVKMVN